MALEKAVITALESQVILAAEADWLLLADSVQEIHIGYGSVYAQSNWTCLDATTGLEIDWTDAPDDIKEAVAYFALADFRGLLYAPVTTPSGVHKRNVIEKTQKLGSMQKTIKYSHPGADYPDPLEWPTSLMNNLCGVASSGGGSRKLIRC